MNTINANILPASPKPIDRCMDTGRVRIGIAYVPRPSPVVSSDAVLLQQALLDRRTARPPKAWERVAGALVAWL